MTIYWSEIETDPKYQALEREQQGVIKGHYFNKLIRPDPAYDALRQSDPDKARGVLEFFTGITPYKTTGVGEGIKEGIKGSLIGIGKAALPPLSKEDWAGSVETIMRGVAGSLGGPAMFVVGSFRGKNIPESFKEGLRAEWDVLRGGEIVSPDIVIKENTGKSIREHLSEKWNAKIEPAKQPSRYALNETLADLVAPIVDFGLFVAADPFAYAPAIAGGAAAVSAKVNKAVQLRTEARKMVEQITTELAKEKGKLPPEWGETLRKVIQGQKENEAKLAADLKKANIPEPTITKGAEPPAAEMITAEAGGVPRETPLIPPPKATKRTITINPGQLDERVVTPRTIINDIAIVKQPSHVDPHAYRLYDVNTGQQVLRRDYGWNYERAIEEIKKYQKAGEPIPGRYEHPSGPPAPQELAPKPAIAPAAKEPSGVPGAVSEITQHPYTGQPELSLSPEERLAQTAGKGPPTITPISRQQIIDFVEEKTGLLLKTGKFRQQALGIWKKGKGVGRIKSAQDIPTAGHELGHGLFYDFELQRANILKDAAVRTELSEMGEALYPKQPGKHFPEGFAEGVRRWMTEPKQFAADKPSAFRGVDEALDAIPGLKETMVQSRDLIELYKTQGPMARAMSNIKFSWEATKGLPFMEKPHRLYELFFDDLHQVKRVSAQVEKVLGRPLTATEDAYVLGRLLRGSAAKADEFIRGKPFIIEGNRLKFQGENLEDIIKPVETQWKEFSTYIAARRAKEYERYGYKHPFEKSELQGLINNASPIFKAQAEKLNKWHRQLFEYAVPDVIPRDIADRIFAKWDFYAPLYRVMEYESGTFGSGARAIAPAPSVLKTVKGSTREILDPLEMSIKNAYAFINAVDRIRVLQTFVSGIQKASKLSGAFAERIPIKMKPITLTAEDFTKGISDPDVQQAMKQFLKDTPEMASVASTIFRPNYRTLPNEIIIPIKGKPKLFEIPEDILRGFKNADAISLKQLQKIVSYPTSMLRAGAVLTPEFALARNPFRDTVTAFIYSRHGFVPGYDTLRGLMHIIGKDDAYHAFNVSGAPFATMLDIDRDARNWILNMQRKGIWDKTVYTASHPLEALRIMGSVTENATRMGDFAKAIRPFMDDPAGIPLDELYKAGFEAREITLDFGRSGAYSRAANSIIAFWNATAQGPDRMIRAFKDRPIMTSLRVGAGITVPSLLLWSVNKDYEWYKNLESWEKNTFWWFGTKDKPILRLPKPFELGIIFGSGPERLMEQLSKKYPKAIKEWAQDLFKNVTPGIIPTAFVGAIEEWANKISYTGRPIVPEYQKDLEPELQYTPWTHKTSIEVGRIFKVAPSRVEHFIRAQTATLGRTVLDGADAVLALARAKDQPTIPKKKLAERPMLRAFMKIEPSQGRALQDFYNNRDKINEKVRSFKTMAERGASAKELRDYFSRNRAYLKPIGIDENGKPITPSTFSTRLADNLSQINKRMRQIYEDKTMTPEQKRMELDRLTVRMVEMSKRFNEFWRIRQTPENLKEGAVR